MFCGNCQSHPNDAEEPQNSCCNHYCNHCCFQHLRLGEFCVPYCKHYPDGANKYGHDEIDQLQMLEVSKFTLTERLCRQFGVEILSEVRHLSWSRNEKEESRYMLDVITSVGLLKSSILRMTFTPKDICFVCQMITTSCICQRVDDVEDVPAFKHESVEKVAKKETIKHKAQDIILRPSARPNVKSKPRSSIGPKSKRYRSKKSCDPQFIEIFANVRI